MFKYKSPLSRLLEGAGKTKEPEAPAEDTSVEEKQEPIADFNALRAALAGGNATSDSYEETEELIPEEKMPDFSDEKMSAAEPEDDPQEASLFAEPTDEEEEPAEDIQIVAEDQEQPEDQQVVTLMLNNETEGDEAQVDEKTPEVTTTEQAETTAAVEETSQALASEIQTETVAETEHPQAEPIVEANQSQQEPVVSQQEPAVEAENPQPKTATAPATDRRSRVKTTFLGFERADTHVQDLMESSEPVAKTEAVQETFPVGWLVVTAGPGRGSSITLTEGLMQIGRNDDQAIQLDFGDTGISRSNHAVIAYDPEDRKCYLGHGGKANLVRLNGKPVLSTVALNSGDLIRISETSIRFAAFCDDGFDWRDS